MTAATVKQDLATSQMAVWIVLRDIIWTTIPICLEIYVVLAQEPALDVETQRNVQNVEQDIGDRNARTIVTYVRMTSAVNNVDVIMVVKMVIT